METIASFYSAHGAGGVYSNNRISNTCSNIVPRVINLDSTFHCIGIKKCDRAIQLRNDLGRPHGT